MQLWPGDEYQQKATWREWIFFQALLSGAVERTSTIKEMISGTGMPIWAVRSKLEHINRIRTFPTTIIIQFKTISNI
jgi:hypothetical protein